MGTVLSAARTLRAGRASAALTALALLIVGIACGDLRVKMEVFNSAEDARRAGAMSTRWMPALLPPNATDLRVGHLPDGQHWGVFAFQSSDVAAVRASLGDEITTGTLSCDPPGRLEFWPRLLHTPVDVERVRSTGFKIFRGKDDRTYAINSGQGRAYYWHQ